VPYTTVTRTTLAVCSGRDGEETIIHAVKFPEGARWSYNSGNMGWTADWAGEAVFRRLRQAEIGATLTEAAAKDIAERLVGEIWDFDEPEKRPLTFEEIFERLEPLVGSEVVDTLD